MRSDFGLRIILIIYLFFNSLFFLYYLSGGLLVGDFKERFGSLPPEVLCIGFFINIVTLFLLLVIYRVCAHVKMNKHIRIRNSYFVDLTLLIVSFFYIFCVGYYGVGVAGVDESTLNVSKFVLYTYAILQPNFIIMIYLFCYYHSPRPIYWLIFLIFIVSSMLSGATINFIFFFLLWASYSNKRRLVMCFLAVGIFISPLIRFLKFVVIEYKRVLASGGNADILRVVSIYKTDDMSLWDTYLFFVKSTFSRFEMTSSSSFILEYSHKIRAAADSIGVIYPQNEYFIYNFFAKTFGFVSDSGAMTLQYIFANYLSGSTDWNAQIGLTGYALINGVTALSVYALVFVLLILSVIVSRLLRGDGAILLLTAIYIVVVLWHGWVVAYIYYFHALLLFMSLVLMANYISKLFTLKVTR
ncbi:MAG: oligosaccharide repeat unit polymerase [Tannerellaceae bacterium]